MKNYNLKIILGTVEVIGALVLSWLIDIEGKDLASSTVVFLSFFGGMNISDGFSDLRIEKLKNKSETNSESDKDEPV